LLSPASVGNEPDEVVQEACDGLFTALVLGVAEHGLERAQNGQRPRTQGAALVARYAQQVADHLHRHRGGEVGDQVGAAIDGHGLDEVIDQAGDRDLHVGDGAWREGPGDDPAHAGVQGRIIENKARRVVLVEQALAIFGRKRALLIGGEGAGVLIEGHAVA
jgi:hypothetical protein